MKHRRNRRPPGTKINPHFEPFMCSTMGVHTDALSASLGAPTGPKTMPGLMVASSHLRASV